MIDFPNKIVTILLIFVMLVIAPLTWAYVRAEMTSERLVLNEMSSFLDRVSDKATVTQQDLDDLYLGLNSAGGTYDVKVKRHIRMATKDENNQARTLYLSDDVIKVENGKKVSVTMNTGDVVKITVKEVGVSPSKRLLWAILRIDSGKTDFSLASTVR